MRQALYLTLETRVQIQLFFQRKEIFNHVEIAIGTNGCVWRHVAVSASGEIGYHVTCNNQYK